MANSVQDELELRRKFNKEFAESNGQVNINDPAKPQAVLDRIKVSVKFHGKNCKNTYQKLNTYL